MLNRSSAKFVIWFVVLVAIIAAFGLGNYWGQSRAASQIALDLVGQEVGKPDKVDFSPFWKAWNLINEKYIADNGNNHSTTTKIATDQDKVWGAIEGLTTSLGDPYSVFLPPEKKKRFEEDIRGNFSGVGMEVGIKDEVLTVITPLPDSPAKKAGVQAGDQVVKINDTITAGLSADEGVNLIRGEEGTTVRLTLVRGKEKPFEISITRAVITIPTLDTKKLADGIFEIKLYNFSATSPNLFRAALRQFIESGSTKLIVDLRGNPGGFLDAAVDMASWFLPAGKPVVIEKHGGGVEDKIYRSAGYDIFNDKLKMVILVDQGSASAAEILAGALAEYGKAILVGQKTFGKGSVQELIPVTGGSSLKLTIAKWYTPKGKSISINGLMPDILVPVTEEDIKAGQDPQLEKAIEILGNK
ncbi:MAG: S41 family peptidase [Candidatus Paceibacterota bacterium]|jgi:carboxyl-terminal processing protease